MELDSISISKSDNRLVLLLILPYCDLDTVLRACKIIDIPDNIMRKFTRKSYAEFFESYLYNLHEKDRDPCYHCALPTNYRTDYKCWECNTIYCTPCFKILGKIDITYTQKGSYPEKSLGNLCNHCYKKLMLCIHCIIRSMPENFSCCSKCNKQMCNSCCYPGYHNPDRKKSEWHKCVACTKIHCPDCLTPYILECPNWIQQKPHFYTDLDYSRDMQNIVQVCLDCYNHHVI